MQLDNTGQNKSIVQYRSRTEKERSRLPGPCLEDLVGTGFEHMARDVGSPTLRCDCLFKSLNSPAHKKITDFPEHIEGTRQRTPSVFVVESGVFDRGEVLHCYNATHMLEPQRDTLDVIIKMPVQPAIDSQCLRHLDETKAIHDNCR